MAAATRIESRRMRELPAHAGGPGGVQAAGRRVPLCLFPRLAGDGAGRSADGSQRVPWGQIDFWIPLKNPRAPVTDPQE